MGPEPAAHACHERAQDEADPPHGDGVDSDGACRDRIVPRRAELKPDLGLLEDDRDSNEEYCPERAAEEVGMPIEAEERVGAIGQGSPMQTKAATRAATSPPRTMATRNGSWISARKG